MSDLQIYVLIPTAQKPHAKMIVAKWAEKGYKIGLFVDPGPIDIPFRDLVIQAKYPGVWRAWNSLAKAAVACGADCCFLVGDDMDPPEQSPQVLAQEFLEKYPDGFGVMQGTGDRQGSIIDAKWNSQRICGSPFIGRGWINRAYRGLGPVDGRMGAFYSDEALLHVARKLGVLWQRLDVTVLHHHWSFPGGLKRQPYHERNDREHWAKDKALFEESLKAGFPEGEPLRE